MFDKVEPEVSEVAEPPCVLAMASSVTVPDDADVSALNTSVSDVDEQSTEVTVVACADMVMATVAATVKINCFIVFPFMNIARCT